MTTDTTPTPAADPPDVVTFTRHEDGSITISPSTDAAAAGVPARMYRPTEPLTWDQARAVRELVHRRVMQAVAEASTARGSQHADVAQAAEAKVAAHRAAADAIEQLLGLDGGR